MDDSTGALDTIEQLLINLDTSNRAEVKTVRSAVLEAVKLTTTEADARGLVKQMILIAFKRRNHLKSQAEGEGAGEKGIFLEVLLAVAELQTHTDLVEAILPLIPLYGCWKDLRVLMEQIVVRELPHAGKDGELHPLCTAVCQLFVKQMNADMLLGPEGVPSNACKYCPHEGRHRKLKRAKGTESEPAASSTEDQPPPAKIAKVAPRGKTGRGRGRVTVKLLKHKAHSVADKVEQGKLASATSLLAHALERTACPEATAAHHGAAAFRKLRAALNARLVARGHLIEPLVCQKQLSAIDFGKANKGSLAKYQALIRKDPAAGKKWLRVMATNPNAVPDLDGIMNAVEGFLKESADYPDLTVFNMQFNKAVNTIRSKQQKLVKKAQTLLAAAAAEGKKVSMVAALQAALVPIIPIVDTAGCTTSEQRMALVLAGVLLSKAQGLGRMVVDGELVDTADVSGLFWSAVCPTISATGGAEAVSRLEISLQAVLQVQGAGKVDGLLLCEGFAAFEESPTAVEALLQTVQSTSTATGCSLRTLRVHRLRAVVRQYESQSTQFKPRLATIKPAAQVTADLVFVMDCTASMDPFIDNVKAQLCSVLQKLQTNTKLQHIRVAFVGYRDYGCTERSFMVPFCHQSDLASLEKRLMRTDTEGNADTTEDLLTGLVEASKLDWQSDMRLMVIVTDANAHGFGDDVDRYEHGGRCPDQAAPYPSFQEAVRDLAERLAVDTLFCHLSYSSGPTEQAMQKEYRSICGESGFGVTSMYSSTFCAQVLEGLQAAVLSTLSAKDVSGLQSADGQMLSSLVSSLTASLRESLTAYGQEQAAKPMDVDDDDDEEEEGEDDKEEDAVSKKPAETDWQRLQRELLLEDLQPVRMALGMPLAPTAQTLSQKAAQVLYKAGLTVQTLQANRYPDPIIHTFQTFLHSTLAHI